MGLFGGGIGGRGGFTASGMQACRLNNEANLCKNASIFANGDVGNSKIAITGLHVCQNCGE